MVCEGCSYLELRSAIRAEFPKYELVWKRNSKLMRVIDVLLTVLSLGKMRTFLSGFITTIGFTVYVPESWADMTDQQRCVILRHERVHMRQRVRYGMALFSFLYVLFPLPGGLAYFRTKFERSAYEESVRATAEYYGNGFVRSYKFRCYILGQFSGPSYLWMWPFARSNERWLGRVMDALPSEVEKVA